MKALLKKKVSVLKEEWDPYSPILPADPHTRLEESLLRNWSITPKEKAYSE